MRPVDDFLEGFLVPLVHGGVLHVGAPLGARALERYAGEAVGARLAERLADARHAVAAELVLRPPPLPLDEEALRLGVAVHDLLFLAHPGAQALSVRGARARQLVEGTLALARLPPLDGPHDPDDHQDLDIQDALIARHTLLHLLPALRRTDVRISFWAGQREFRGQVVPPRYTAWPELRRVQEERVQVSCLDEAAVDPVAGEIVRALLAASPLTGLLHPQRAQPRFDLAALGWIVGDAELCRAVAYRWLEPGLDETAAAIATAVLALLDGSDAPDRGAPVAVRRAALALVAHVHLCLLLGGDPEAEVRRIAARREGSACDLLGLYAAILRVAPELALPADVAADRALRPLVERHAAACAAACPRTVDLGHLVARAIGTATLVAAG